LEEAPLQLSRELDWVIKRELIGSYIEKKGCRWDDPRVSMMDLQYHDLRKGKGLYNTLARGGYVERIVTDAEIQKAHEIPPEDTRAYFRAMCLKKFPKEVYAASWSSVQFDVGNTTIKRIPLMEPLKGTKELISDLLEKSDTAEELIKGLAA
jgi:proteasome accessory factor A